MALFRSERGIGRGEVAESRLEVPFFALFMVLCSLLLLAEHLYFGNDSLTLALAISMVVFGVTVARVDFGVYILVIAMLLSPELDMGNDLSGEQSLNLRYDDILILVIFIGVMVKIAFEGRLQPWQSSPVNAGILAYYSVCIISTLFALERNLGAWDRRSAFFTMLKMLEFYLVFWLVGLAVRNRQDIRKQLPLFFLVSMVVSVYAIYTIRTEPRVSAPFETGGTEPNTLGGYLLLVIFVAMGLFTQARYWRQKMPFLLISGVAFIPLLYTLSRASYMGLVVGLSVLSVISRKYAILILMILALASSSVIMPEKVKERVRYTFEASSGQEVTVAGRTTGVTVDKSTHERFLVWRKVRYILGMGGLLTWFGGGVTWESVLDSQYARVILETGLVGLAAFLFLQYRLLRCAREAYRWSDDWVGRGISMGVFAATLGLVTHSMGTISFLIVRIMEPYWFLVALTVTIRNQALLKSRASEKTARAARPAQDANQIPAAASPAMKSARIV